MTNDGQINSPNDEEISVKRKKSRRRLYPFLAILGITVGFCITFFAVGLFHPIGSGPAGPKVDREPFATVWSEKQVLLLGIGDSVTAGFGVPVPYGYVNRLADNPPDEFPEMQGICLRKVLPKLEVKNIAVSGSTSLQHESYLNDDERFPKQPENVFGIVVMTTGGNDIIHNYGQSPPKEGAMYGASIEQAAPWIENFRGRLDRMIDRINEKFPGGCMIFLADIYDPTDGVGDAPSAFLPAWPDCMKVLDAYNTIIAEAATKHQNVVIVPIHEAFLGHGIHCSRFWQKHYRADDPTYWFHTNLEDPNIRGYDAIRRLFLNEIVKKKDAVPKYTQADNELSLSCQDAYIALRNLSKTVTSEFFSREIESVHINEMADISHDGNVSFGEIHCHLKDKTFSFQHSPPFYIAVEGVFYLNEKGKWEAKVTSQTQGHPDFFGIEHSGDLPLSLPIENQ